MQQRPLLRPWLEGAVGYRPGLKAATQDGRLASNECPALPPGSLRGRSIPRTWICIATLTLKRRRCARPWASCTGRPR